MSPYAIFFLGFMVSFLLTPLSGRLAMRAGAVDVPRTRHRHRQPIPRWGGLALAAGFFAAVAVVYQGVPPANAQEAIQLQGVLLGGLLAVIYGVLDDWRELPAWPQFVLQFGLASLAILHTDWLQVFTHPLTGVVVRLPELIAVPLTVFWVMGMMNTINWLDGLDGLAGGVAAIAALLFAAHSYFVFGQLTVALLALALASACLGFLPWNFYPARIFMGTAGSAFLGYTLATLAVLAPAKTATALLVLGIPILDVAWQILTRLREGRAPWLGDRGHLHHRLYDLGLSQRTVVSGYYAFCAGFGGLALILPPGIYKVYALGILGGLTLTVLWLVSRPRQPDGAKNGG